MALLDQDGAGFSLEQRLLPTAMRQQAQAHQVRAQVIRVSLPTTAVRVLHADPRQPRATPHACR
ncbi:MAG: hypothetical protein RMM31_06245 [Anaerolineae bacterium]|nr:hypothetical protein [Anaerolineae bacterium]